MADLYTTQVAAGPLADLGYCEEVSFGSQPTSPTLKTCRRRSTSLGLTKDQYQSEEVRSDRMVSDARHGLRHSGGDIVTELSPESHADFMEALLGSYWQTPTAIDASVVNLTATLNATTGLVQVTASSFDFAAAGLYLGASVTFTSTSVSELDGILFTVVAHSSNRIDLLPQSGAAFTLAGSPESISTGTFHVMGAYVDMGNITRSFTFERSFNDIGKFIVYKGQRFSQMAVDLPATGIATATYTLMGQDASAPSSASIDGVSEIVLDETDMTSLTFAASTGQITRGGGSWISDGINVGDVLLFAGTGITTVQNRNPRTVVAVNSATVITVAEAIETGGPYSSSIEVTRVGLPAYTAASDESVLVAVSGVLIINGEAAATVTGMSFSIDNQIAGSEVVGANVMPALLYGNQCVVSGNMTVLFDRGGAGETLYNAFEAETDISLVMRLDKADGTGALTFSLPRVKPAGGQIGDAEASGLPVSLDFTALKPLAANTGQGESQIYIYDTEMSGIAPQVDDLVLTFVSEASGVATLSIAGGVAPYSFANDGGSEDEVEFVDGEFTWDYTSNGTYDPVITDATGDTATVEVTITTGS